MEMWFPQYGRLRRAGGCSGDPSERPRKDLPTRAGSTLTSVLGAKVLSFLRTRCHFTGASQALAPTGSTSLTEQETAPSRPVAAEVRAPLLAFATPSRCTQKVPALVLAVSCTICSPLTLLVTALETCEVWLVPSQARKTTVTLATDCGLGVNDIRPAVLHAPSDNTALSLPCKDRGGAVFMYSEFSAGVSWDNAATSPFGTTSPKGRRRAGRLRSPGEWSSGWLDRHAFSSTSAKVLSDCECLARAPAAVQSHPRVQPGVPQRLLTSHAPVRCLQEVVPRVPGRRSQRPALVVVRRRGAGSRAATGAVTGAALVSAASRGRLRGGGERQARGNPSGARRLIHLLSELDKSSGISQGQCKRMSQDVPPSPLAGLPGRRTGCEHPIPPLGDEDGMHKTHTTRYGSRPA